MNILPLQGSGVTHYLIVSDDGVDLIDRSGWVGRSQPREQASGRHPAVLVLDYWFSRQLSWRIAPVGS